MRYREHRQDAGLFNHQERMEGLKRRETALGKLNETVDWDHFHQPLETLMDYSNQSKGGRPPTVPVFMFNVGMLQKYNGLSEEDTQFHILDRFSFQCFLWLDVSPATPDKNTVRIFKERLGKKGREGNSSPPSGCLVRSGLDGAAAKIVDATIVETKRKHTKTNGESERLNPARTGGGRR